jgi:hypothetical protein
MRWGCQPYAQPSSFIRAWDPGATRRRSWGLLVLHSTEKSTWLRENEHLQTYMFFPLYHVYNMVCKTNPTISALFRDV